MTDGETFSKNLETLRSEIEKTQKTFYKSVEKVILSVRNKKNFSDASVLALSYRHQLVDDIAKWQRILAQFKSTYEKMKREKIIYYKNPKDFNYNFNDRTERKEIVTGDLSDYSMLLDLVKSHIEWDKGLIANLDGVTMHLKRTIDLHNAGL